MDSARPVEPNSGMPYVPPAADHTDSIPSLAQTIAHTEDAAPVNGGKPLGTELERRCGALSKDYLGGAIAAVNPNMLLNRVTAG